MNSTIQRSEAEYAALAPEQLNRLWDGGNISGLPVTCEFCDQPAVWATVGSGWFRLACYDLRHIAGAESVGSAVEPESLLSLLARTRSCDRCHA